MQIKLTGAIMNNTNGATGEAATAATAAQPQTKNDPTDLFECPVCLDYAIPPIPQCQNGHIVCSSCRKNVNNCPTCRVTMSDIRNLTLEKLAEDVQFPCKFRDNGCAATVHYQVKEDHETSCDYRLFNCPSPDPECRWVGCVQKIFDHLKQHELVTAVEGRKVKFMATEITKAGSVHWVMVQSCFGRHFLTILEKETVENDDKYSAFIKMMGSKNEASKFTGRVELRGGKGRLMWMGTPYAINDSAAEMKNDCLSFDTETANRSIDNNSLTLTIQIFSKNT